MESRIQYCLGFPYRARYLLIDTAVGDSHPKSLLMATFRLNSYSEVYTAPEPLTYYLLRNCSSCPFRFAHQKVWIGIHGLNMVLHETFQRRHCVIKTCLNNTAFLENITVFPHHPRALETRLILCVHINCEIINLF